MSDSGKQIQTAEAGTARIHAREVAATVQTPASARRKELDG
jgi:hypothetical protein